jgi:Ala-tRNA(Pro) deacylase
MAVSASLQKYLANHNVVYALVPHQPTMSSMRTAQACHIPGDRLAKGVLIRNSFGHVLAVLPASRYVDLAQLESELGQEVELATEAEVVERFGDCSRGAVPAVGQCYGVETIVDDTTWDQPEVYIEAGDHETLIRVSHDGFEQLNRLARQGRFSAPH